MHRGRRCQAWATPPRRLNPCPPRAVTEASSFLVGCRRRRPSKGCGPKLLNTSRLRAGAAQGWQPARRLEAPVERLWHTMSARLRCARRRKQGSKPAAAAPAAAEPTPSQWQRLRALLLLCLYFGGRDGRLCLFNAAAVMAAALLSYQGSCGGRPLCFYSRCRPWLPPRLAVLLATVCLSLLPRL